MRKVIPATAGVIFAISLCIRLSAQTAPAPQLDYEVFKTKVQPIFLAKRPGHARCIECHENRNPFLQELAPD